MDNMTSSPEKLIYEGNLDLELNGINIGKALVKVYEGAPTSGASRTLNPHILHVKAIYNHKHYETVCNEGGINEALQKMKKHIEDMLKKGR